MKHESSTHNKVLFRTDLISGESGRGYLLRTAENLELRSFYSVLDLAGVSHSSSVDDPENVEKLGRVLRVSELNEIFYLPIPGHSRRQIRNFLGHPVDLRFMTLGSPRVCPHCLTEGKGCQSTWDVAFVTVCPKHGCQLIAQCPSCDRPLTWKRRRLQQCDCGADFGSGKKAIATPSELAVADLLYSKARPLGGHTPGRLGSYPKWLERLTLNETLRLISFLGQCFREVGGVLTQATLKRSSLAETREVVTTVDQLLSNWPENFRQALADSCNRRIETEGKNERLQDVLHQFLSRMMRDLGGQSYKFLHQVCDDFILRWSPAPYKPKRALAEVDGKTGRRWISAPEVAALAGTETAKQIRKYVREGVLKGLITPGGRVGRGHIWIERESAMNWLDGQRNWMTRKEAKDHLGLSTVEIMRLAEAGVLEIKKGAIPRHSRSWNFLRIDIEKLSSAFSINAANPNSSGRAKDCVTLNDAMGMGLTLWPRGGLIVVVRNVLEKKLLPAGRDSRYPGMMGSLFVKSDLRACLLGLDLSSGTLAKPTLAKNHNVKKNGSNGRAAIVQF